MLAKEVVPQAPRWVLPDFVARGVVTLVAGARSIGKGLFVVWLTKEVTTAPEPGKVWINSVAEDDRSMILRPRLETAGADLGRVRLTENDHDLPADLARLEADVATFRPDMLVLDSVQTHIRRNETAEHAAMKGLAKLARSADIAIVLVAHFVKALPASVSAAIGGSGAIQNRSKAIFVVGPQPGEDGPARELRDLRALLLGTESLPDRRARLAVACERMGIAELPPTLSFELATSFYRPTGRPEPYLDFIEETTFSAGQILAAQRARSAEGDADGGAVHALAIWVLETLAAHPLRMMPKSAMVLKAKADGVFTSERTFERARRAARVRPVRPSELHRYMPAEDYISLPDEAKTAWWVAI